MRLASSRRPLLRGSRDEQSFGSIAALSAWLSAARKRWKEIQHHSRSLEGSRRLRLPAIPATHATTDGRTLPVYPPKANANCTEPLITTDTSEASLYKTEDVESKNRLFQDWQWTKHVENSFKVHTEDEEDDPLGRFWQNMHRSQAPSFLYLPVTVPLPPTDACAV